MIQSHLLPGGESQVAAHTVEPPVSEAVESGPTTSDMSAEKSGAGDKTTYNSPQKKKTHLTSLLQNVA